MKYHFYLKYEVFGKYQIFYMYVCVEIIVQLIHDFQRDFPRSFPTFHSRLGSYKLRGNQISCFQIRKCRTSVTYIDHKEV